jgi:hypothetical protein
MERYMTLELQVRERQRQLLREAEHGRLVAAARERRPRLWGRPRGLRAPVYAVGSALMACGAALMRWSAAWSVLSPATTETLTQLGMRNTRLGGIGASTWR